LIAEFFGGISNGLLQASVVGMIICLNSANRDKANQFSSGVAGLALMVGPAYGALMINFGFNWIFWSITILNIILIPIVIPQVKQNDEKLKKMQLRASSYRPIDS
jgi:MFS family permease